MKYHSQTTLLSTGTKPNAHLSLNGKLQFPAIPQNDSTSRSHPPVGKRGFTMLQGYTTAFACSFCFQYSHMFLYGIQCSPFTGCEYMWLTYIWWFHLSGVGSPFLVNLKNWKHMAWNFLLCIIANIKQDMYQNVHFSIDFNNNNLKIT